MCGQSGLPSHPAAGRTLPAGMCSAGHLSPQGRGRGAACPRPVAPGRAVRSWLGAQSMETASGTGAGVGPWWGMTQQVSAGSGVLASPRSCRMQGDALGVASLVLLQGVGAGWGCPIPGCPAWACPRSALLCGQPCSLLFLAVSLWQRWHHNSLSSSRTTSTSPALASPSEYLWVRGTQPGCPAAGFGWPCYACIACSWV